MSLLPESAVKEFIELYKKEYGVVLSPQEGRIKAQNVFNLLKSISTEISKTNNAVTLNSKDIGAT